MVGDEGLGGCGYLGGRELAGLQTEGGEGLVGLGALDLDRKSTRLNSSHAT